MPHHDTIPELGHALGMLNDRELAVFVIRMGALSQNFYDSEDRRVSDVFAALCVLGAEQQDRRRELAEHARRELDDHDGVGGLFTAQDLDDLDDTR